MKININTYLKYYFSILLFFSIIYLHQKHSVGNDSTISEWLINYSGGFTKRGIIGQLCIYIANYFNLNLRDSILISQISILALYFVFLYFFLRNIEINKILLLAIFTPIFILYPVAELEVLARKEIFIFCIYLLYFFLKKNTHKFYYKLFFLPLAVLIWEPVFFFFLFIFVIDLIEIDTKKLNIELFKIICSFIPATILVFYIALNPLGPEKHAVMENYLMVNFNENCYMSCGLLLSKSSIYEQFAGNFNSYSFVIFFRYTLIILIGFGPLFFLALNSTFKKTQIIFLKKFNNLLSLILVCLTPVIFLFAMGYDWGRWVNISYVFSILFYLYLYKTNQITLDKKIFNYKILSILKNKKIFIAIFIIFCFGWNQKTVVTGDVATNPLWKVPYNASKIIFGFNNFRILQETPIIKWHKQYIE
jgi:hypothetical protein